MKVPILIPNIFDHPFTYESGGIDIKLGDYVLIPFGKSKITGVVWNEFEKENKKKFLLKKVISKLNIPSLNKNTINFLNWFSQYNLIPKGMALKLLLFRSEAIEDIELKEFKKFEFKTKQKKFSLTEEQGNALKNLNTEIDKFRVHVLQGTTGSGKTIVYFESIKAISNADVSEIERCIKTAGLHKIKAVRIKDVLNIIESRIGGFDLSFLAEMPLEPAKNWLKSLPGITIR